MTWCFFKLSTYSVVGFNAKVVFIISLEHYLLDNRLRCISRDVCRVLVQKKGKLLCRYPCRVQMSSTDNPALQQFSKITTYMQEK